MSKIFTTKEAADVLHQSDANVRKLCIKGKLKATKLGKHSWMIREEDLADYVVGTVIQK